MRVHKLHPPTATFLWCNVTSCSTSSLLFTFDNCIHGEERVSWKRCLDLCRKNLPMQSKLNLMVILSNDIIKYHALSSRTPRHTINKQKTTKKLHTKPPFKRSLLFLHKRNRKHPAFMCCTKKVYFGSVFAISSSSYLCSSLLWYFPFCLFSRAIKSSTAHP